VCPPLGRGGGRSAGGWPPPRRETGHRARGLASPGRETGHTARGHMRPRGVGGRTAREHESPRRDTGRTASAARSGRRGARGHARAVGAAAPSSLPPAAISWRARRHLLHDERLRARSRRTRRAPVLRREPERTDGGLEYGGSEPSARRGPVLQLRDRDPAPPRLRPLVPSVRPRVLRADAPARSLVEETLGDGRAPRSANEARRAATGPRRIRSRDGQRQRTRVRGPEVREGRDDSTRSAP
jgi:hypothetical protein